MKPLIFFVLVLLGLLFINKNWLFNEKETLLNKELYSEACFSNANKFNYYGSHAGQIVSNEFCNF